MTYQDLMNQIGEEQVGPVPNGRILGERIDKNITPSQLKFSSRESNENI